VVQEAGVVLAIQHDASSQSRGSVWVGGASSTPSGLCREEVVPASAYMPASSEKVLSPSRGCCARADCLVPLAVEIVAEAQHGCSPICYSFVNPRYQPREWMSTFLANRAAGTPCHILPPDCFCTALCIIHRKKKKNGQVTPCSSLSEV
jgi:hypothetical protein